MVEELAALLRCVCGHRLSVELREKGERICNAVIFDQEPSSDTFSERVRECPGCGVGLGLHTLLPATPLT